MSWLHDFYIIFILIRPQLKSNLFIYSDNFTKLLIIFLFHGIRANL